jgi:putative SOS response-associated peptidase YedK
VAPTDVVPVVRRPLRPDRPPRVLSVARWGLLPHWAKDPRLGARMINARAETVTAAPAYADAFAARRALVPVDGWYEWLRLPGGGKQPYFLTPVDGTVLALAGLWSRWGPQRLLTFTVVTTAAVGALASIHDRMPLLLPQSRWRSWLTDTQPSLDPPDGSFLAGIELRPVGPSVGNVRNDGPALVRRMALPPQPAGTLF